MQSKALTLTAVLALALLAGCSDAPPSGTLVAADAGIAVEGLSTNSYRAATNPVEGQENLCAPEQVPTVPPVPDLHCTEAETNLLVHFMSLPEPDGNGYSIVLTNNTGGEKNIGNIAESNGMYELNYTIAEDYSTTYTAIELRMGDFTYATAPATAGPQAFVLGPGVAGVTATGTFKGKTLDVDLQNLPPGNAKYTGRLYTLSEDGNLTAAKSFPLVAGANHYEDEDGNIGDYAEFHVHVGQSKINLFKAKLE